MARKITKRQQQIYDFIKEYQQEKGYPPSVREMASAVGLSSPSTVHAHLSALEARGLLKRDATKPRALELFDEDGSSVSISKSDEPTVPRGTVSLPLVGRVAAGIPILAEQNIEDTFTIPTEIATEQGSFILEVHGNSMINVGIYNGDYIIVREQKSAMNGEIVVAMIDGSATVKTFYKENRMNAADMVQGNLALKLEAPATPAFTVVKGGRSHFQAVATKPVRTQRASVASAPVALKASTIVAVAVAFTLFFVLATSVFSARHAAYADSVANVTYETVRVQSGDSLWSLAQEHPIDGLSTQETSDMIRSVNHLDRSSLDAGAVLKVPARS